MAKPMKDTAFQQATGRRWDRPGARLKAQLAPYRTSAHDMPSVKFCIFAQGRTGSSVLRSLLNNHPDVDCVGEILRPNPVLFPLAFVERNARLSGQPAFGFKLKIYHLTRHQGLDDPAAFMERLAEAGYRILFLRRENVLRHAFSNSFAFAINQRHFTDEDGTERAVIEVNPDQLIEVMRKRQAHTRQEAEAVSSVPHLALSYEQDLLPPGSHQAASDRVFEFIGLQPVPVVTKMRRSVTGGLHERIANFDAVESALSGTEFEQYLNDPAYEQTGL